MVNYYFFCSEMHRNAQGENRTVLRAVPNQTTYCIASRGLAAVRTDLKVQADSASLARIVRKPLGTVWGIKVEGRTQHAASLKVYTRNNENFYRAEGCIEESDFEGGMLAAWRLVSGTVDPEIPMDTQNDNVQPGRLPESAVIHSALSRDVEFVAEARQHAPASLVLALSRLFDALLVGAVRFKYEKNGDGSVRTAVGTLCGSVIDEFGQSRDGSGRSSRPFDGVHVHYYDLERNDWRCFTVENIQVMENGDPFDPDRDFIAADTLVRRPELLASLLGTAR